MEAFLYFRQKTLGFFIRNEAFLMPVIKFITMMAVLLLMNWHLGYRYVLMYWILVILASLVSALLPWSGITALAAAWLIGHVSALSLEGAAVLILVILASAMLHYLFLPGGSVIVLLLPLAFYLKVPYLLPLLAGLFGTALGFIPVGEGVIIYYLMTVLEKNAAALSDPGSTVITAFTQIINGMNNPQMYLTLVAFCAAALAVYGISHLHTDYAHIVGTAVGGALMLLTFLMGGFGLSLSLSYVSLVVICIVCTAIAVFAAFWTRILDYSCTEYLEYEDDDYVYYVKAVPKMQITEPQRRVHDIETDDEEE